MASASVPTQGYCPQRRGSSQNVEMMEWLDDLSDTIAMGTRTLAGPLFLRDDDFDRDLDWKAQLLAERHDDVFAALDTPVVLVASREILRLTGTEDAGGLHPLDAAGRRVQEDLCLLVLRDGAPHLDAASLCFPSYWRLADKLGKPLADVHGPVPHYGDQLAGKVDGFLNRLRGAVWRRNWSIHDEPTYFLPVAGAPRPNLRVPDDLYLRSERQVLRRLDTPGTVLFTIRTQQVPLAALQARPDVAHRLVRVIDKWSTELVDYKAGHGATAARDWLASRG
jgi:heme-dependent oxidative N-demethylase alpha subunit-like protein